MNGAITLNQSAPSVYIYYVRFKGNMSRPTISVIPSLNSTDIKQTLNYFYKTNIRVNNNNLISDDT